MEKIRDGNINRLTGIVSDFEPVHFIRENYISHASRVHNHLLKKLSQIGQIEESKDVGLPKTFEIQVRDKEIWINDCLLSKPHAVEINFEFFYYIRRQSANSKITKQDMPEWLKKEIGNKRFIKLLNNISFKSEIRKAFFYKVGQSSLFYRGDKITKEELEKGGVKIPLFLKELELAHTKNSPE